MAAYFAAMTRLLADTSVRALLLAVLAAIVLGIWPARNANFQHRAWSAVLWGMLLLPVLAQFTPALSLLPAGWRWESERVARQASAEPRQTIPTEPDILGQPGVVAGGEREPDMKADPIAASSTATRSVGQRLEATVPITSAFGWRGLILVLYLFGVALLVTRLAHSYLAVRRLVRRATDIPRPLGCRARVATSDAVRVPVSVGLLKPVILLPADWSRWSQALLSSVVAHEQAHIDRRDHLVLLVSELNRCLYWFHPVAWFLRRRLSALAEQCCDDTVIAALRSRGDYARHLLEIASRLAASPRRVAPLGISMARSSQVESRIVAILDERRPLAGRIGRRGALALAAIIGPIMLLAAGLRAADPPPQKQQEVAAKPAATTAPETKAQPELKAQPDAEKPAVKGVTVSGRVVLASDGSPVMGAEVRLPVNKNGIRLSVRTAKTNEQGEFSFEDVPAGSHFLVAVADALASRSDRMQATKVQVAADHPAEPVLLKLAPAPSIAVHVTAKADGTPLAGARVRLIDPFSKWEVQTDAEGSALLRGLTPEVWEVEVQAPGFAAETVPQKLIGDQRVELNVALEPGGKIHGTVKDQDGKPLPNLWVGVRIKDVPFPLDGVYTDAEGRYHLDFVPLSQDLVLVCGDEPYLITRQPTTVPGGSDRDVVVNLVLERRPDGGSIQGVVTDLAGKPIVGATLTNRGTSSNDVHETFTVGAGRFTLDDVYTSGNGTFVVFRAKGFAPQAVSINPGPADEPTEIAVRLEPGHRIDGRVLDVAGKPIAGVSIKYGKGGFFQGDSLGGLSTTDAEGRFEFDSLPADCPFDFELKGYSSLEQQELVLDGDEEVTITLQPPGIIRGRVVNAASGAPVKVFRVRIMHSPDREPGDLKGSLYGGRGLKGEQFKAADGQFLLDDLTVGLPLQVTVDADDLGMTTLRRVLPRPAADAEIVEFKLGPTDPAKVGIVAGIIVDEEGKPKAGAQLRLIVAKSDSEQQGRIRFQWGQVRNGQVATQDGVVQFLSTTTDRQGAFRFDHVRVDHEMELLFWGEGISDDRVVHLEELTDGQRQQLHIENPTPGAIEGKINRETFPGLRRVFAVHQGVGGIYNLAFHDQPKKADYQFRNLPPGRYLLGIIDDDPADPRHVRMNRYVDATGAVITDLNARPPRFRPGPEQFIIVEPGKTTTLDIGF